MAYAPSARIMKENVHFPCILIRPESHENLVKSEKIYYSASPKINIIFYKCIIQGNRIFWEYAMKGLGASGKSPEMAKPPYGKDHLWMN